jgi:hypothetical protein
MKPFQAHVDTDVRKASARRLVQMLLDAEDLYPAHRREFVRLALWKVTMAESGKYDTRYRSKKSMRKGVRVQHEHVFERAKLADELLQHPEQIDAILNKAVACVVTVAEHRRLTQVSRQDPKLSGWERYKVADIEVIDTVTGHLFLGIQSELGHGTETELLEAPDRSAFH